MKALPLFRRWWSAQFVRVAVWSVLALTGVVGGVALAYELALARVPQHRATLELLVRAQTGLDVRFNELNLHWGWYGPEAVFHRVELGEPGRSNVLLRAPQLIVGFDAWRTVQSGQLQAGRITFIAPDINLQRTAQAPRGSVALDTASQNRTRLLQRWRGGRIEIEGGTLRLPDPAGSADALALQIRRASVRRSDDQWSASALVFLPERLGHSARIAAHFTGDITRLKYLKGSLRFDGLRLQFAGWRQVLGSQPLIARHLPATGEGDVSFRMSFEQGQVEKADGRVHAQNVSFSSKGILNLKRLRGEWRLAHRDRVWQLRVAQLDLGAVDNPDRLPDLALDIGPGGNELRGTLEATPLESLATLTSWLAPQIDLRDVGLQGAARDLQFDWNHARLEGDRLRATATAEDLAFSPPSRNFTLTGLRAQLSANENGIDIALDTDQAKLWMARLPGRPLEALHIVSELRLSRQAQGWHLNTALLTVDHGPTQLILSGSLSADSPLAPPLLDLQATLVRADVALIQELLGDDAQRRFGAVAAQLTAGRIERAQLQLQARLDGTAAEVFTGSLSLQEGHIRGSELWPEVQDLQAQLQWSGDRMRAQVSEGRAGSIQLVSGQAEWNPNGTRLPQISGQARGRFEDALQWLGAHPKLQEYTAQLRHFAATGDALFNFDISLPNKVTAAVLLEAAQLQLARDLPPIRAVRGSLAFDRARLQASTLTGQWLGGPVSLRVSEKRTRRSTALLIQAQGMLEAQELIALAGFEPLTEVSGDTAWSGELTYQAAHWELAAQASLIGVSSRLPEPLSKTVVASLPLRVEASGAGEGAGVRVSLGDRLKSQLKLVRTAPRLASSDSRWQVERGAVRFGSGAASLPGEPLIAVQGRVSRFDLPAYASLWQRAGKLIQLPVMVADLIAEQLWLADRMFPDVRVQARKAAGATAELNFESPALNGSLRFPSERVEVHLTAQNLDEVERARIVSQLQDSWTNPLITIN